MTDKFLPWLSSIVSLSTVIIIETSVFSSNLYWQIFWKDYLPQKSFNKVFISLLLKDQHSGLSSWELRKWINLCQISQSPLYNLPQGFKDIDFQDWNKSINVAVVETNEDVERMMDLAKKYAGGEIGDIEYESFLNKNPLLVDVCRWGEVPCNCNSLPRLLIQPDGSILPCFHGKAIGMVDTPYPELVKAAQDKYKTEIERRGCRSCAVYDKCSKCIFPYPLSVEEYCDLRKNHSYISEINKMFSCISYDIMHPFEKSGKKDV